MSEEFNVRLATIADSAIMAWHRARMFQDMGYVPVELFDAFRAQSEARLRDALASGEYVGWLASQQNSPQTIIAGAGVQLRQVLPHPIGEAGGEITICDGRQGIILNVFTEPEWRRQGVAALLMKTIIEWSREQCLEELVLHASDEGRALYERLGFVFTSEMRFGGNLAVTES
jgi:GNAT superfamily N-acetyltransferase